MEHRKILARTVNKSPHCEVCKKKIIPPGEKEVIEEELGEVLPDKLIGHHIRYVPEKKIDICASCHSKIHHSKDEGLKPFLPEDSKPKKTVSKRKKTVKTKCKIKTTVMTKCKRCGCHFAETKQKCPECGLDKPIPHARTCEKCGYVFNGYGRTTCPKCRTFFITRNATKRGN